MIRRGMPRENPLGARMQAIVSLTSLPVEKGRIVVIFTANEHCNNPETSNMPVSGAETDSQLLSRSVFQQAGAFLRRIPNSVRSCLPPNVCSLITCLRINVLRGTCIAHICDTCIPRVSVTSTLTSLTPKRISCTHPCDFIRSRCTRVFAESRSIASAISLSSIEP